MEKDLVKIALIALFPKERFNIIGESQGVCSIAGFLEARFGDSVNVLILDQQCNSDEDIQNQILEFRPQIIGFSMKMGTFQEFEVLYKKITRVYIPQIICCGNSFAHFNKEFLLHRYPEIIVSRGEGEPTFEDIVLYLRHKINFNDIRNITYVRGEQIYNNQFEFIDSQLLHSSNREHSKNFYNHGGEIYIEGSRGCAYCGCTICECRYFLGSENCTNKWRPKESKIVVSELMELVNIGIDQVTFSDEDFFGNEDGLIHAEEIADGILNNHISINFRVNARVQTFKGNEEQIQPLLSKLHKAGLVKIFLGFESGSPTQLKRYGKGFSLDEFLYAHKLIKSVGISCELGFIPFDPLMEFSELVESFNFVNEHHLIDELSAIIKSLRIQGGNKLYLKLISKFEEDYNIKLIDGYDPYTQTYPILRFKDNRVQRIWNALKEYGEDKYADYYTLRIQTQYSNHSSLNTIINYIRANDYELVAKLFECYNEQQCDDIVKYHSYQRDMIYKELGKNDALKT